MSKNREVALSFGILLEYQAVWYQAVLPVCVCMSGLIQVSRWCQCWVWTAKVDFTCKMTLQPH
jgi:hypothetical protein